MTTTAKITDAGLLIPKQMFEGIDEVEIQQQDDRIVVIPRRATDPILGLGQHPVVVDVEDASVNHDLYL